MSELQKGYLVDGQVFTTKAEAEEYMRIPQVKAALVELTEAEDSAEWILANKEAILESFKAGAIRRVSAAEKKELASALDKVTEGFLNTHREAVIASFRWPTVSRDSNADELIKEAFMELCEDNEALADWLIANKDNLNAAFITGKPKREVSQKAIDALAKYRAEMAAQKAELEAAEKEGPEAVAVVKAKHAAADKARKEAKAKEKAEADAAKKAEQAVQIAKDAAAEG